jgi:hypothetical protein
MSDECLAPLPDLTAQAVIYEVKADSADLKKKIIYLRFSIYDFTALRRTYGYLQIDH